MLLGQDKVSGFLEAPIVGIELALLGLVTRNLHIVLGLAGLLALVHRIVGSHDRRDAILS